MTTMTRIEQMEVLNRFFRYIRRKENIDITITIDRDGSAMTDVIKNCRVTSINISPYKHASVFRIYLDITNQDGTNRLMRVAVPVPGHTFTDRRTIHREDEQGNSIDFSIKVNH